jgi:osmotically-inducible protein OsmY
MTTATRTRTDEQIQRDVMEELKWDARVQPNEIGVVVKNGVVTLTSAERTDADIASAVVRALEWDALVPTDKVHATVSKGWVTLEGQTEWEYQKRAAERAVRRLAGVRGVTNLITVRPQVTPTEEELRRRVQDALVRSAETDAERISVKVIGDKVILDGRVRSWAEKDEAERVAWSAPGVASVDNRITVHP